MNSVERALMSNIKTLYLMCVDTVIETGVDAVEGRSKIIEKSKE